ncbi:MAG: O-antigen ligase family protein, partial [Longimicrobiales bacterium]
MSRGGALQANGIMVAAQGGNSLAAPRGYYAKTLTIAIAMLTVVAVRLHEFIPMIGIISPVLLVAVGGSYLVLTKTRPNIVREVLQHPIPRLALVYFLWAGVTVVFALWRGLAVESMKALLPAILLCTIVALCPPRRAIFDRVLVAYAIVVGIFSAYGLVYGQVSMHRLSFGGMYDSNDIAAILALSFPITVGVAMRAKGRARWLAAASCALLVMTIVAANSRGSILGFVAGALVFVMGMKGERKILVLALFVLAGAGVWATASQNFRSRMVSITNLENDYNTTAETGRKAVWRRGRGYIRQHPVFGVGVGNFPIAEGATLTEADQRGKWSAAHNAYIQSYAELGLFGGTVFVLLIITGARQAMTFWHPRTASKPGGFHRPELLASIAA